MSFGVFGPRFSHLIRRENIQVKLEQCWGDLKRSVDQENIDSKLLFTKLRQLYAVYKKTIPKNTNLVTKNMMKYTFINAVYDKILDVSDQDIVSHPYLSNKNLKLGPILQTVASDIIDRLVAFRAGVVSDPEIIQENIPYVSLTRTELLELKESLFAALFPFDEIMRNGRVSDAMDAFKDRQDVQKVLDKVDIAISKTCAMSNEADELGFCRLSVDELTELKAVFKMTVKKYELLDVREDVGIQKNLVSFRIQQIDLVLREKRFSRDRESELSDLKNLDKESLVNKYEFYRASILGINETLTCFAVSNPAMYKLQIRLEVLEKLVDSIELLFLFQRIGIREGASDIPTPCP